MTLMVVTSSLLYYRWHEDQYLEIYTLLSNVFGYSVTWLPVYYYMASAYHFCRYTVISLHGLAAYSVINILYSITKLLGYDVSGNYYVGVFEATTMSAITLMVIYLIISRRHGTNDA